MIILFLFLAFFVIMLPGIAAAGLVKKAKAGTRLVWEVSLPLDEDLFPEIWRNFIRDNGFTVEGYFQYEKIHFALYRQTSETHFVRLLMIMKLAGKHYIEFVTEFSMEAGLTTSAATGFGAYPRFPGDYCQQFRNTEITELYKMHLEGETYLLNENKVRIGPLTQTLGDRIDNTIRRQGILIGEIPFYQVRAVYWFWIRRFLVANKTIKQLHGGGWYLPRFQFSDPELYAGIVRTAAILAIWCLCLSEFNRHGNSIWSILIAIMMAPMLLAIPALPIGAAVLAARWNTIDRGCRKSVLWTFGLCLLIIFCMILPAL